MMSAESAFRIHHSAFRICLAFRLCKYHSSGGGLQYFSDHHVHLLIHQPAAFFDDDHRAVVQVGHALPLLFAFLNDFDCHPLARQNYRFDGVGQIVDVEHGDALQTGDLVEIVVGGEDGAVQLLGQNHQLVVGIAHAFDVHIGNAHGRGGFFLQAIENVQPAPPAVAPQYVRRVGNVLKLVQDEARHQHGGRDEAGLADVGDAPVNDHAG